MRGAPAKNSLEQGLSLYSASPRAWANASHSALAPRVVIDWWAVQLRAVLHPHALAPRAVRCGRRIAQGLFGLPRVARGEGHS